MDSVKVKFEGEDGVTVVWGEKVSGLRSVAQKAAMTLLTGQGTDKVLPLRGTRVAQNLMGHGAYDFLTIQHQLNFGAVKVVSDVQGFETAKFPASDRIEGAQVNLVDVKSNIARTAIRVRNRSGEETAEITVIE